MKIPPEGILGRVSGGTTIRTTTNRRWPMGRSLDDHHIPTVDNTPSSGVVYAVGLAVVAGATQLSFPRVGIRFRGVRLDVYGRPCAGDTRL